MKTKYLLILAIFAGFLTSCKNAEEFQDVLYFTGTETSPVTKMTVDGPSDIGLSVSSSSKVDHDVQIQIKATPELLESYNLQNGKVYQNLPEGCYELSTSNLTLSSGKCVSSPFRLTINSVADFKEGVTYCLPVSIVNVDGNIPVLETSRTVFVVINQVIITKAASLKNNYFAVPFAKDVTLNAVPKLTMEARVFVNAFQPNHPKISSIMGIEEHFLLRFGDVNIDMNQIQLAGGKDPVTGTLQFETNKWYHVAVVFDGIEIKLYINGELDGSISTSRVSVDLTDKAGFYIGRSAGGRLLNGAISEVRVWTKALTSIEIANNICYVDPISDGLLAYWRFNEGEGRKIKDWTGHGWDIEGNTNVTWVEGVRCPE